MKALRSIAALAVLSFAFAGCGGSGGGSSTPNPFAGQYAGAYSSSLNDTGTYNVAITNGGAFTATGTSNQSSVVGTVTGHLTNAGALTATLTYQGSSTRYTATGTLTRDASSGVVTGTLNETDGSNNAVVQISLSPVQTVN